jgi:hypothetical protein
MKAFHLLAALVLGAAISGCSGLAAAPLGTPTTIHMKQQSGSGQIGTATLRNVAGGVQVDISIANEPHGASEPAHIHTGSCAVLTPAPYLVLSNVVNGHSTTIITRTAAPGGVTVAKLIRGHYAINVHKSLKNIKTYVSCGDLWGAH